MVAGGQLSWMHAQQVCVDLLLPPVSYSSDAVKYLHQLMRLKESCMIVLGVLCLFPLFHESSRSSAVHETHPKPLWDCYF
jgi:hypothetical protein